MADLFLDTDVLGIVGADELAKRIRPAGYDLRTLDDIFAKEVAPAVGFNLLDVAGEWAGWDPDWLRNRILVVRESRRLRHRLNRLFFRGFNTSAWQRVRAALED